MRKGLFFMLLVIASGCAHLPKSVLPPLYENRYPIIVGVQSSKIKLKPTIDSLLVSLLSNSGIVSGVVKAPFDKKMIDIIMSVEDISVSKKSGGFLSRNWEVSGSLTIDLNDAKGNHIKTYRAETKKTGASFPLFPRYDVMPLLFSDLITRILDEVNDDFEGNEPEITHINITEHKEGTSETNLLYPILSDFKRNFIRINAEFQGSVPPERVTVSLSKDIEPFLQQELYFRIMKGEAVEKKWLFSRDVSDISIPFDKNINYQILVKDAMGNEDIISKGTLRTISKSLFRLKQIEVITQGTIITSFGGLLVVLLMYSL